MLAAVRKLRILCTRELQNSIRESTHYSLKEQIELLGLESFFDIQMYSIKSLIGSEFIFEGVKNDPRKIKSLASVDICFAEESENISSESWEILIPTILRKPGSEIWVVFNPNLESDPTSQMFLKNPPPNSRIIETNWRDNPWLDEKLKRQMAHLAKVDPDAYQHVYEGKFRSNSAAQVLSGKWVIEEFIPDEDYNGPYQGLDFGFSSDPTCFIRCWTHDNELFIEYEAYGLGVDTDKLPALFDTIPLARAYACRADSARPETISALQRAGYTKVCAVEKWAGSVLDGVAFLRSFTRIVIHPRCVHTAEEAMRWEYKTDRLSGDILPDLKPGHDHCIAAGELIETARGHIPIESVVAGDKVLTRSGWRPVIESWCASPSRAIWVVEAGGNTLRATPDHKIWTQNGWAQVGALTSDDYVVILDSTQTFFPSRVEAVYAAERKSPVYDLAVADCHEFVASGILVSNCWDAARYALAPLIKNTGDWSFTGV